MIAEHPREVDLLSKMLNLANEHKLQVTSLKITECAGGVRIDYRLDIAPNQSGGMVAVEGNL
jgi:hypothetical protein